MSEVVEQLLIRAANAREMARNLFAVARECEERAKELKKQAIEFKSAGATRKR